MTTEKELEDILCQIVGLSDAARAELAKSIIEMHLEHLGISYQDDNDPDARNA